MKSNKEQELIEAINNNLTQTDRWELSANGRELTDKYCRVTFEICWMDYAGERCLVWNENKLMVNPTKLNHLIEVLSVKKQDDKLNNLYLIYKIGEDK